MSPITHPTVPSRRLRLAVAAGLLVAAILAAIASAGPRPASLRIAGPRSAQPGPATYVFRSPGARRARFRCSLDAPRLHACPARYRVDLAEGAHVLRAQALVRGRRPSAVTTVRIAVERPIPSAGAVAARIFVPGFPSRVAFAAGSVWVPLHHGAAVARVDPATNAVASSIPIEPGSGEQPGGIAEADGRLWLVNYTDEGIPGSLVRLDPGTGAVSATVRMPAELCCDPIAGAGRVWTIAPDLAGGSVVEVDAATGTIAGTFPAPRAFSGAFGAGSLWLGAGSEVLRVDPGTRQIVARIPVGPDAQVMAFGGETLWVARGAEAVRIDPATNAVSATVRLPNDRVLEFRSVAFDGDRAWMSGTAGLYPVLWRIDLATSTVTGAVRVDRTPGAEIGSVTVGVGSVWALLPGRGVVVRVAPA